MSSQEPLDLRARHRIEEEFHDSKAISGVNDFYGFGALEAADAYCWGQLGSLTDKKVLELGCGDGRVTIRFAQEGAFVTAIDIAGEMVELTKKEASAAGFESRVEAKRMSGEELTFASSTFDIIYGHSILHHLNLDLATPQIGRVLKPGGIAIFLEPLDYNPILNLFRSFTPHRRTPTERPLRFDQLEQLGSAFSAWQHKEFYLLSIAAFVWYYGIRSKSLFRLTLRTLQVLDRALFKLIPGLRKLAWVTVVTFTK